MAPVENQQYAVGFCSRAATWRGREEFGECYCFAVLVRQCEFRRLLPDPRGSFRRRQLPDSVEEAVRKETDARYAQHSQDGAENFAPVEFRLSEGSPQTRPKQNQTTGKKQ